MYKNTENTKIINPSPLDQLELISFYKELDEKILAMPWSISHPREFFLPYFTKNNKNYSLSNYYISGNIPKINDEIMSFILTELVRDIFTNNLLFFKPNKNVTGTNPLPPEYLKPLNHMNDFAVNLSRNEIGYQVDFYYNNFHLSFDYLLDPGQIFHVLKTFKRPVSQLKLIGFPPTFPFDIINDCFNELKKMVISLDTNQS